VLQLPDRAKRWAILYPTEVLPKPLRLAARKRLLEQLELTKARRAGLIIVGHPKSGNTWLRVLISRLYQVRHDIPASLIAHSDELHRQNPAIPYITATNGWYSYEGAVGRVLAAGAPDSPMRHKPIVFLARNPCDIAVSWFLQVTKRQSKPKFELINDELGHPLDRTAIQMWDFVRHSDLGVMSLIAFLNTWARNMETLEHSIMVRYEDLRADPGRAAAPDREARRGKLHRRDVRRGGSLRLRRELARAREQRLLQARRDEPAQSRRPGDVQSAARESRRIP
jgi:hypothetical protein